MGQCKVDRTGVIKADSDQMWLASRNFEEIAWNLHVTQCRLISGWDAPAPLRELVKTNGHVIIEQLTAIDEDGCRISFRGLNLYPGIFSKETSIAVRPIGPRQAEVAVSIWLEIARYAKDANAEANALLEADRILSRISDQLGAGSIGDIE